MNGRFFDSRCGLKFFFRDSPASSDTGLAPLMCLHGLTRNSEDFVELAGHLKPSRRVLALDFRGRGRSDFDPNYRNYFPTTYADDVVEWLDHLGIESAVFCGTSLGGIVTMVLAEQAPELFAGAIINDIGPEVAMAGIMRIGQYVGKLKPAENWDDAIANTKIMFEVACPDADAATWDAIAKRTYRLGADGRPVLKSDPNIGKAFQELGGSPVDPWGLFEQLGQFPLLALRGETSDLLAPETLVEMAERVPSLVTCTVANRGHAPWLNEPDALAAIDRFLASVPWLES